MAAVFWVSILVPAMAKDCNPAVPGFYTKAQVQLGAQVFSAHCAECHGATLTGVSAPPLTGPNFQSFITYSKISALQLLKFVSTQMPNNAPGSLSKSEYRDVLSYILNFNSYPEGGIALSARRLSCLSLLPYPKAKPAS